MIKKFKLLTNTILIISILALVSCKSKVDFKTDFAKNLLEIVELSVPSKLEYIKSDTLINYSVTRLFEEDINFAIRLMDNSELMKSHLQSLSKSVFEQDIYCTLLLYYYVNDKEIDESKILEDWKVLVSNHNKTLHQQEQHDNRKTSNRVFEENDKYVIGDTISAFFIKGMEFKPPRIGYSDAPDENYYKRSDYFKIIGIVMNKKYSYDSDGKLDRNFLDFTIKVLEMSETNIFSGDNEIVIGSNLNIDIEAYERILGTKSDYYKWGNSKV